MSSNNNNNLSCAVCHKSFPSARALSGHSRTHGQSQGSLHKPRCCCVITKQEIEAKSLHSFQASLIPCNVCHTVFKPSSSQLYCSQSCRAKIVNSTRAPITVKQKSFKCTICDHVDLVDGRVAYKSCSRCDNESRLITDRSIRSFKLANSRIYNIQASVGLASKLITNQCAHCQSKFVSRTRRKYCEAHKSLYTESAKGGFKFTFNVFDYPELFNLELVKQHGFYCPNGRYTDDGQPNINGVSRDHKVSVNEAIRNNYDPYYITHPLNCEIMLQSENNKKKTKSSISYEELKQQVDVYTASTK